MRGVLSAKAQTQLSALVSKALIENGFSYVYELQGGYLKWSSSGKKVEGGEGKGYPSYQLHLC